MSLEVVEHPDHPYNKKQPGLNLRTICLLEGELYCCILQVLLIGRYCMWYISGIIADRTCFADNVSSMEVMIAVIR